MNVRGWCLAASVIVVMLLVPACAKQELKLEMSREVTLISPTIESVALTPSGPIRTWEKPQTVRVMMKGDPELEATFKVEGRSPGNPMREIEPGVYLGSLQIPQGEAGTHDVIGRLVHTPSGAEKRYRLKRGLVLDRNMPAELAYCTRKKMEEFEQRLTSVKIPFEFNHHDIPPEGVAALNASRSILEAYPLCPVRLHGHADEVGSERYNLDLSIKRALAVQSYLLTSLDIPRDRIEVYFHGEKRPVDTSGTPEGQARNRRVECHAVYID